MRKAEQQGNLPTNSWAPKWYRWSVKTRIGLWHILEAAKATGASTKAGYSVPHFRSSCSTSSMAPLHGMLVSIPKACVGQVSLEVPTTCTGCSASACCLLEVLHDLLKACNSLPHVPACGGFLAVHEGCVN